MVQHDQQQNPSDKPFSKSDLLGKQEQSEPAQIQSENDIEKEENEDIDGEKKQEEDTGEE
ncbi:hypothetical protein [Chitinophaga polysaccharea]|uniref:hypothetical protein n=1 Tax=Chitinophaga polysaccharea TaxID=1293035 RepID=UPI00115B3F58|nr:hypothetical protein [Chitinophaga polysaccharea]